MALAVSWTSGRDSAEMSAGTMKVEFSEPLSGSLLLVDPEEAVRRERSGRPRRRSAPNRSPRMAHPTSLPTTASSISTFESYCRAASTAREQLLFSSHLADAERRARAGRLDEDGIGEPVGIDLLARRDGPEVRRGDARASGDDVGQGLVHAQRGALDIAADVGDAGQLQQTLHRAVLAELAVQDGEHQVEADRLVPSRCPGRASRVRFCPVTARPDGSCRSPSSRPGRRTASTRRRS